MKSIYSFISYKIYLKAVEAARITVQRGFRTRMSEAIGCQNAFISQVLNGDAHLSLEQAIECARFLELDSNEEKFFLLLVQLARAGSKSLKEHFEAEVIRLREESLNIEKKVSVNLSLSEAAKTQYYSKWYYAAIHVLVSIDGFQTIDKISQALKLSRARVQNALLFLLESNLVEENNGIFKQGNAQLHLSKNAPQVFSHHQNWRLRAIEHLHSESYEQDVHYSTVSSLSHSDAAELRRRLLQTIEDYVQIVRPSKEETAYAFTLDFFKLTV